MATTSKTTAKAKDEPDASADATPEPETAPRVQSTCVVDATFHVGRAVNGKVCSYHAVSHRADGTPR